VIVKRPHFLPRLASFELAWTDAAFDAIYPEPPRSLLPHGVASMHPARFFDDVLATIPLEQSLGLRATLWMVALAPLFTIRRLGTIASLDADDRARVLTLLVTSPNYFVRQLAMSFKAMATLLYAKSAAVRAAMTVPSELRENQRVMAPHGAAAAPGGREERGLAADTKLISATRLTSRVKAATEESGESHDHAAA
jgi:hypothetical protein